MIDFKLRNNLYFGQAYKPETKKQARDFIEDIKNRTAGGADAKYALGLKLTEFYASKSYSCRCSDEAVLKCYGHYIDRNANAGVFFAVCDIEFGLDRSEVSRLMNVVDEFGKRDRKKGIRDEYKEYKYSVLVEMLPMSAEERAGVTPDMTVKQVRDLKSSLVATSQTKKQEKDEEPERFKSYTRRALIDYILELEARIEGIEDEESEAI
ncbi:MAG: hypothetical protein IJ038_05195 [Clostridia bacterium]|nr:hypothetical protein [Clostridia bacterium]